MPPLDPAWIALIGTLCGGIGLKVLEHWLGKSKYRSDEATQIRSELRQEVSSQKEEVRLLSTERDAWRKQYYDLRDKYTVLRAEHTIALDRIRTEIDEAQKNLEQEDRLDD